MKELQKLPVHFLCWQEHSKWNSVEEATDKRGKRYIQILSDSEQLSGFGRSLASVDSIQGFLLPPKNLTNSLLPTAQEVWNFCREIRCVFPMWYCFVAGSLGSFVGRPNMYQCVKVCFNDWSRIHSLLRFKNCWVGLHMLP